MSSERCALTPGADVATGRWNGVLIAVKVVEHTGEHEGGRAGIVEGARESLLAASVSHPNVIPCYKVQPAQHSLPGLPHHPGNHRFYPCHKWAATALCCMA